jgi:hypothetical protein
MLIIIGAAHGSDKLDVATLVSRPGGTRINVKFPLKSPLALCNIWEFHSGDWRMSSSWMWRRAELVWADVLEECIVSVFMVEKSASEVPTFFIFTATRWLLARGFFYHEDGSDTFLRNISSHKIYTAPHPRRRHSPLSLFRFHRWMQIQYNTFKYDYLLADN